MCKFFDVKHFRKIYGHCSIFTFASKNHILKLKGFSFFFPPPPPRPSLSLSLSLSLFVALLPSSCALDKVLSYSFIFSLGFFVVVVVAGLFIFFGKC